MIEVVIATVMLSIVIAGAYNLSNRSTRLNQASYERSRATNLIQEQAESIRSAKLADDPAISGQTWDQITTGSFPSTTFYDCRNNPSPYPRDSALNNIFYISDGPSVITSNYKTTDNLYYTWVARENDGTAGYYDFHIFTCWQSIGGGQNQMTGATVRVGNN